MNSRSFRVGTAFVLTISLWVSGIGVVGAYAQQPSSSDQKQSQDQSQSAPQPSQDQNQSTQQPNQKADAGAQTRPTNKKPLSTNEDPTMIGKRNIGKGGIFVPGTEKEVRIGRQLAAEVEKTSRFIDDPIITEYVNRVGQNIVLHSDAKVPFTIKVIDSDEVNAFALPGGFFFVNKGLILAADNEAEMAGVMAHEIGHVAARHAMRNEAKATVLDIATLAGIIFGGPIIGNILYNGGGFFEGMAMLKFTRAAESEADRLGVQYMWAAGYDPSAMATMFEKLESKNKKKPGTLAKMFMDHPAPAERRAAALALAARFPEREEYLISTSEFQRVKARLMRLSNARASATGAIAGGDNSTPGRPTLKRRQPTPDDSTTGPADKKPEQQQAPPKLKRADGQAQPAPSPEPTP